MNPAVKKLLRFAEQTECQHYLSLAQQSYFADFAVPRGLENIESVNAAVGDTAMEQISYCMLEFFFSNDYQKDGDPWNVIDLYLKKRNMRLDFKDKQYLRALRRSYMSLYEVLEVDLGRGLVLRDMIGGGTIRVQEKLLTRHVVPWDILGLRVCVEGDHIVLAGGGLVFDRESGAKLAKDISDLHQAGLSMLRGIKMPGDYSFEERERLLKCMWAKEIGTAYLEECLKRKNRKIKLLNREGHIIQFYTLTFSLQKDWEQIAAKLHAVKDLHCDEDGRNRKFWNWVDVSGKGMFLVEDETADRDIHTFDTTLDGGDLDGPIHVLGTLELLKGKLVAEANSLERAQELEKKIKNILRSLVGEAAWEKKDLNENSNDDDIDKLKLSPKETTEAMHAMLTQHYRNWMTMSIPALGGKSPKQLSKTVAGRQKLARVLKDVENSVRHLEREAHVLSPLDLGWL